MRSMKAALVSALACLMATAAIADAGDKTPNKNSTSSEPSVTAPNDNNNYRGDLLWWRHMIRASNKLGGDYIYCIPAGTSLIGDESELESDSEQATYSDNSKANKNVKVTGKWLKVRLATQKFPYIGHLNPPDNVKYKDSDSWQADVGLVGPNLFPDGDTDGIHKSNAISVERAQSECSAVPADQPSTSTNSASRQSGGASTNGGTASGSGTPAQNPCAPDPAPDDKSNGYCDVHEGDEFYINANDLDNVWRAGWEYGALAVPFKFQLSKGGTVTSQTSVGPYLGFRVPITDSIVFSPVGFVGAAPITVSEKTGNTTSSHELAAITYGGGLLFTIKDSFQAGLIFGADHVDSNAGYPYNDKLWVSFALGYSFAR